MAGLGADDIPGGLGPIGPSGGRSGPAHPPGAHPVTRRRDCDRIAGPVETAASNRPDGPPARWCRPHAERPPRDPLDAYAWHRDRLRDLARQKGRPAWEHCPVNLPGINGLCRDIPLSVSRSPRKSTSKKSSPARTRDGCHRRSMRIGGCPISPPRMASCPPDASALCGQGRQARRTLQSACARWIRSGGAPFAGPSSVVRSKIGPWYS